MFELKKVLAYTLILAFSSTQAYAEIRSVQLVSTSHVLALPVDDARVKVDEFLQRSLVRDQMRQLGVDPEDTRARLDALTPVEINELAFAINELPAAGLTEEKDDSGLKAALPIIALVMLLILLIFKMTGKKAKY